MQNTANEGIDSPNIEPSTTNVAQDGKNIHNSDNASRTKFGYASRVDAPSIDVTTQACATSRDNYDDIQARIRYLDGPIAVRLSSLTFLLDVFCARLQDPTTSVDACVMRDVIQAIMRACRDSAPNFASRARTGVFRILKACLEREPLDARAAATALKSVVFVGVEHSACAAARAHMNSECERILEHKCCDQYTGSLLRMVIDGRYRDCALTLHPACARKGNLNNRMNTPCIKRTI